MQICVREQRAQKGALKKLCIVVTVLLLMVEIRLTS